MFHLRRGWNKIIKVTMAAVAGGTASVLGGGKFANGAMAGAFIMMFNEFGKSTYPSKDKMYKFGYSKWKMGENGIAYKSLMVNGVDTGNNIYRSYGPSGADKFFYGIGQGIVNNADAIGLGLSIAAVINPGFWGYSMGAAAIGLDFLQQDTSGMLIGVIAMTPLPGAGAIDIGYGVGQLW